MKTGKTNNPNGRPLGKPNRVTTELKQRIKAFLDDNFDTIEQDFKSMEPKDRAMFFEKLLSYAIPKQSSTDISMNFEQFTEDDLNTIVTNLLNQQTDV